MFSREPARTRSICVRFFVLLLATSKTPQVLEDRRFVDFCFSSPLNAARVVDSHLSADPLFVSTRTQTPEPGSFFVAFGVDSSSPSPSRVD